MRRTQLGSHSLAATAASSVVLTADAFMQAAAPEYWVQSQKAHQALVWALAELPDPRVRDLRERLLMDPADAPAYRQFAAGMAAHLGHPAETASGRLTKLTESVDALSRLRVNPGSGCLAGGTASSPSELLSLIQHGPRRQQGHVDAAVIIPFRGSVQDSDRVRNLAAALNALSDQSYPRERYHIVVVESDSVPRWRDLFAVVCDAYIFAPSPLEFSKAWAVNVGVVHGARTAGLVCVLDADILVDQDFILRGISRSRDPGSLAHMPFQDILFLDDQASSRAISSRCVQGASWLDHRPLRGVYLRQPPGACVWLRAPAFARIGGMDERFSAWGGEDQDFIWRIERFGSMRRYADPMVHLNHRRAPHRRGDGRPFHAEIRYCSWPSDSAIGDLRRYGCH